MLWLKRLTASKMKPVGAPDFNKAPWRTINLSGTKLRFKNPPQTTSAFFEYWPDRFDLYGDDYELWPDGQAMSKDIFRNGWCYFDHLIWGDGNIGGVRLYISLQRLHPHNRRMESMFKPEDVCNWIIRGYKKSYEHTKHDKTLKDYQYPETSTEIERKTINGYLFYSSRVNSAPFGWDHYYETPITDDHLLTLLFSPSSLDKHLINEFDNVEAEAEKTIKSFMENVHIHLSDDALRCQAVHQNPSCPAPEC